MAFGLSKLNLPDRSRLRSLAAMYALHGLNLALPLVTLPIITRALGPSEYGLFTLAIAAAGFLQILLDVTVEEAMIKYGFHYTARSNWGRLRRLYRQAMDEGASLAKAKGVALEPDSVDRMLAVADRYKYDARVSMLEDLEAGKPLELDWLSGYVSREAGRLGVPAPFHDIAYACLSPFKKGAPNNGPRP